MGAAFATTLLLCLALSGPGAASPDGSDLTAGAGNGTDVPSVPVPLADPGPTDDGNRSLDAVDSVPVSPVSNTSLGSAVDVTNNDSLASRVDGTPLTAPGDPAPLRSRNRTTRADPLPTRNGSRDAAPDGPFTWEDSTDRDTATDPDGGTTAPDESPERGSVGRSQDDRVARVPDGADPRALLVDGPLSTVVAAATDGERSGESSPEDADGVLRDDLLSGAPDVTGGQSATALLALIPSDHGIRNLTDPVTPSEAEGPVSAFALSDDPVSDEGTRPEPTTPEPAPDTTETMGGDEPDAASTQAPSVDGADGTAVEADRTASGADRTAGGANRQQSDDGPTGAGDDGTDEPPTGAERRIAVPGGVPDVPVPTDDLPSGAGAGAGAAVGVAGAAAVAARQSGAFSGTIEAMATTARTAAASGPTQFERLVRLAAPLRYSRYDDSDPLEHDSRAAIHEVVQESPGTHLTAIAERTELPLSTVRYHVRILKREDLLSEGRLNGKRRFYPSYAEHRAVTAAMNDEATGPIVEALARLGSASVSDLAAELDRTPSTITHHVQRLEEEGVVTRERDGRSVANRLSPEARAVVDPESPARNADGAAPVPSD